MKIKLMTYNIDCLPEKVNLKDLPWILKPISWIYKLIRGTTIISVNDGQNHYDEIMNYIENSGVDIIGVQEDFSSLSISKIFSCIKLFPYPKLKSDGLRVILKNSASYLSGEEIRWKKSYGYFSHANDKLASKGFKYCCISINGIILDVYILHMDADFYHSENCPNVSKDIKARESQLKQLTKYIIDRNSENPIIIMGDTNSSPKYIWDIENIQNNLIYPINNEENLEIYEAISNGFVDVDRIFYINNTKSKYKLKTVNCFYDTDIYLSDHFPFIVELEINDKK